MYSNQNCSHSEKFQSTILWKKLIVSVVEKKMIAIQLFRQWRIFILNYNSQVGEYLSTWILAAALLASTFQVPLLATLVCSAMPKSQFLGDTFVFLPEFQAWRGDLHKSI